MTFQKRPGSELTRFWKTNCAELIDAAAFGIRKSWQDRHFMEIIIQACPFHSARASLATQCPHFVRRHLLGMVGQEARPAVGNSCCTDHAGAAVFRPGVV